MRHIQIGLIAGLACLAACGDAEDEAGLTRAENQELDEAAAALDEAQAEYESAIQAAQPDAQPETQTDTVREEEP